MHAIRRVADKPTGGGVRGERWKNDKRMRRMPVSLPMTSCDSCCLLRGRVQTPYCLLTRLLTQESSSRPHAIFGSLLRASPLNKIITSFHLATRLSVGTADPTNSTKPGLSPRLSRKSYTEWRTEKISRGMSAREELKTSHLFSAVSAQLNRT